MDGMTINHIVSIDHGSFGVSPSEVSWTVTSGGATPQRRASACGASAGRRRARPLRPREMPRRWSWPAPRWRCDGHLENLGEKLEKHQKNGILELPGESWWHTFRHLFWRLPLWDSCDLNGSENYLYMFTWLTVWNTWQVLWVLAGLSMGWMTPKEWEE